jgi:hypothetical protein
MNSLFYLILFHKNPDQLILLINSLMNPNSYFFIHIDEKTDFKLLSSFNNNPKVVILNKRINVYLSTWKLIDATNELIKTAKEYSSFNNIKQAYYILLSGQDYKVKSRKHIDNFLFLNYPANFIDITPFHKKNWIYYKFNTIKFLEYRNNLKRKLGNNVIFFIFNKLIVLLELILTFFKRFFEEELNSNNVYYGGSAWWILSDTFIDYYLNQVYLKGFYYFLKEKILLTPEEVFFQTIIMNSPFKEKLHVNHYSIREQNCLTYSNFKPYSDSKFTGHPYLISKEQISALILDPNYLFARKFDILIDSTIFDSIDNLIQEEEV